MTIRIPLRYIILVAVLLSGIYVLQSMFPYLYSNRLDTFDWFFEGLQPLISFGLWALFCPVLYRYYPWSVPKAHDSFAQNARRIRNAILIAGVHRTLSMLLFWVFLYIFHEAYVHETFFNQALRMYGTGWFESLFMFAIVMVILKGYNTYQEQQIKIFDLQRDISHGIASAGDTPWQIASNGIKEVYQEPVPASSFSSGIHMRPGAPGESILVQSSESAPILLNPRRGIYIDNDVIAPCFYDRFHSLLSEEQEGGLTIGIISPNPGDGKTLVASNLAVSLAMGYQKKTVLIDFNMRRPDLHHVFDVALSPGLTEVIDGSLGKHIHLSVTPVRGLYVLTAGGFEPGISEAAQDPGAGVSSNGHEANNERPEIGAEQLSVFLEIVSALESEFDCVVIDMPSVNTGEFPALLSTRLERLLAVVNSTKTRQNDVAKMLSQLNEDHVMGFVLNQTGDSG